MKKQIIFFILIIISINFLHTEENTKIKTAVINFTPIGVDKSTSDAIAENFINLLIDSKAFDLTDKNQIKNLLSNLGIIDSEGFNEELKNQLLTNYNVRLIILGNVTKIGDIITVNIKGINTEKGSINFAKNIMTNNINDIAFLIPLLVDIIYEIEVNKKNIDVNLTESIDEKNENIINEKKEEEIKTDIDDKNKVIIIINDDKDTVITTDNDKTTIKTEDKKENEEIKTKTEDKEKEIKEAEIELEKQEKEIKEQLEKEKLNKEEKIEEKKIETPSEDKILLKEIKVDNSWSSKTIEIKRELKKIKFKKIIITVENNCVEFARAKFYFDDPYDDIKISNNFFLGKNDIWSKTIETLTKKGAARKLSKINFVAKNRECYNDLKAVIKIYGVK